MSNRHGSRARFLLAFEDFHRVVKTKLDQSCAPGFPVMMTLLVQFLNHRHDGR